MSHPVRVRSAVAVAGAALLALTACGTEEASTTTAPTTSGGALDCSLANLPLTEAGTLTIGTDSPAYEPYFQDDDPTNGKGFESAVAYAVAENLGFTKDQVTWVVVPFNSSYAPGDKNFDFDINQISITPERQQVVDFSDGYYAVQQAVVAIDGTPGADATTIDDLKALKLGAQVGTTSLKYIQDVVQPMAEALVFDDTAAATQALKLGNIDGLVVDLPTAFYITAVELDNGTIAGAFPAEQGGEQFGMLFQKGNGLVPCVNQALAQLKAQGTLQAITDQYLGGQAGVPTFQ
ncbi:MAG TPA: ABC transporter substrate-binding protein [Candidatus Limnocylindria bacterium]|nr:ABC transporter substrate-binding protein [Candidatus Limnocylindria bacterium]